MGEGTSRSDFEEQTETSRTDRALGVDITSAPPSNDGGIQTALPASTSPHTRVPGYRLLQEIDRDERSVVFKAVQQTTGKTVAVRLIERGLSSHSSLENLARQAQELTALNRATEPGIIDQGRAGEEADFVVTELVAESPLADMLEDLLHESKSAGQPSDHVTENVSAGHQLPNR